MACTESADPDDNFALVADALTAMPSKEIVTKTNHASIQSQAHSGKATGYIPQITEQSYADTYQLVTQKNLTKVQKVIKVIPEEVEVRKESERGYLRTFLKIATSVVVGAVCATVVGLIAVTPISVPIATVLGVGAATGGVVGGVVFGGGAIDKHKTKSNFDGKNTVKCDSVQILISSSNGRDICLTMPSNKDTIQQLKVCIQEKLGINTDSQCLSYQGTPLEDSNTIESYNITDNSTIILSIRIRGGSEKDLYFLDSTYLDPSWDYDFTNTTDGDTKFTRGGYPYYRPCGWKRIAIKVTGKYSDEAWLGHTGSKGEWAVTYHGTAKSVFDKICDEGYKVGQREAYSKGVYSSPFIDEAQCYAMEFPLNGVTYLGILQNRVNPEGVNIVNDGKYWVCPNPKDIRPYGLCVKSR